jgi:hypothetical protein
VGIMLVDSDRRVDKRKGTAPLYDGGCRTRWGP